MQDSSIRARRAERDRRGATEHGSARHGAGPIPLAEEVGFEPTDPCRSTVFETDQKPFTARQGTPNMVFICALVSTVPRRSRIFAAGCSHVVVTTHQARSRSGLSVDGEARVH